MNVTDIAILIAVVGITASIIGISFQLMRLIDSIVDNVKEFRTVTKNLGTISDRLVEEQKMVDDILKNATGIMGEVKGMVSKIKTEVIMPLVQFLGVFKRLNNWVGNIKDRYGGSEEE